MKEDTVNIEIEWPEMKVNLGMIEITYQLEDILEISGSGNASVLEVTDNGLVVEYGEDETEFVDMRPLLSNEEVFSQ
jgi:hypothetical protein